ncbi:MAG TPA: hypothetical protein VKQ32_05200 [Polyangia bacterium]|nr:hypothetical protein [Polyangia bacterium]
MIIANDSATDNWTGEYAMLLANSGGPPLAGIIVNASSYWTDLTANVNVWNQMVAAARASGLRNIPDATPSASNLLVRPADGTIESTTPNNSDGAKLIRDLSAQLSLPSRPLVVVTGSRLTDVADAYLLDHTVADRVVVVSSLGAATGMGWPNGELDPWADWIVGERFRYIQINGYYDQTTGDVTKSNTSNLPSNAFGMWMAAKLPTVLQIPMSSDQIGVLAVGVPTFVTAVSHAVVDPSAAFDSTTGPPLVGRANGSAWVVPTCDGAMAGDRLWKMLLDPHTFGH